METGSEERALVERARAGDAAAFRALVDRHRDRAFGLAWRIVGVSEEAEEVAQDAFVRAWRALPQFRGDSAFGTWLHRIVARLALDRRESLRARERREIPSDPLPEVAAESLGAVPDPALALRLERFLEALSPVQRAAIVLYHVEDRPVLEIADLLALPENTVKTHLARARVALREAWMREASGAQVAGREIR